MPACQSWRSIATFALLALLVLPVSQPRAWHDQGHYAIALHATHALPDTVPEFFRHGAAQIAHGSLDPDVFKNPGTAELERAESMEHYINLEYLDGRSLPANRREMLALLRELDLAPGQVGLLPYAITEWTQRLTLAFAEYRRWPDDPMIQAKALVHAGILSHYTADLTVPLHTTLHNNGRRGPDGRSPRTGIHGRVDNLLNRIDTGQAGLLSDIRPRAHGRDLMTAVTAALDASHAEVDRVYELEAAIPPIGDAPVTDERVVAFALERFRHGVSFTADLFLTAWENSDEIRLPGWLDRPPPE